MYFYSNYIMCNTYCEHILTKSLSVVAGDSPLMYRLVFDSCSEPVPLFVEDGMLLLTDCVPLWLPVWLLELLALLGGGVGTRWLPYWKKKKKNINQEKKECVNTTLDHIHTENIQYKIWRDLRRSNRDNHTGQVRFYLSYKMLQYLVMNL